MLDLYQKSPYDGTLVPLASIFPSEIEAIHQVFWRLEQRWDGKPPDAHVWHAYEALPTIDFLAGLRDAINIAAGRRFLDVGCGIGRNLAIAHCLGLEIIGIEQHLPYLEAARELVPEAQLIHANALDMSEFDADIIYMYRPGVSEETELQIEMHVAAKAITDTVLFLPERTPAFLGEPAAPHIWRL